MSDIVVTTNYSSKMNQNPNIVDKITTFKVRNPMLSYFAPSAGIDGSYRPHAYDLYEYGRIMDVESFVCRAFLKKRTLMFKEGYDVISNNEQNAKYIKRRLSEIAYVSGQTFDALIRETSHNLVVFHNAYVVKVRKLNSSSGKVRTINRTSVNPIAAYFNLPPESVQVMTDQSGTPIAYRQKIQTGKYVEYPASAILHLHYNKRTGFIMGTPPLEPVKDDILALRRIEESIETLIYKSLFPIIHVKVGNEKQPAKKFMDGTSEVEIATSYLDKMEDDGGIVTSERVEIKAIGAESLALRVESYLNHFKERVFIGLGMSGIDFGVGDSTGRATGEVLSESLKESVIDYQYTVEEFITEKLFAELLCESGKYQYEYMIGEDDKVYFQFNDLDVPGLIKKESHQLNKMTQGAQSINEARKSMGHKPKSPEELKQMAKELQYDPNQEQADKTTRHSINTSAKTAENAQKASAATAKAGHKAAQTVTTKVSKSKSKVGSSNLTKSITKPANQHNNSIKNIINIVDGANSFKYGRLYNIITDEIQSLDETIDINTTICDKHIADCITTIVKYRNSYNNDNIFDFISNQILSLTHQIFGAINGQ
jgi:hypothetical protein